MIIYCLTNRVNGKVYIGQTCRSLRRRWCEHCWWSTQDRNRPLESAIRKYGAEAFDAIVLWQLSSKETANQKETEEILARQANIPAFGYNLTTGGEGVIAYLTGRPSPKRGKTYPNSYKKRTAC